MPKMLGSVLVTGGTGYLGRHLVRRLLADKLSDRVCVYSRGEHAQADMRAQFDDDDRLRFFIGDCRDLSRLRRAFGSVDVVIHAAALKRIEVGAYNPVEMVRTNVDGTINVIEAAQDAGVKNVMFISSDKAWQPVSPYGQSKALAEAIILAANETVGVKGPRFAACRYGNVWASAGSILPKWRKLLQSGSRAVPVTNPECTRFFMTIDEAVDLVLDTVSDMRGGELAIPDLPAYRVGDLAEAMGALVSVTGLPVWEKLHEGMADGVTSDIARRMSIAELRQALGMIEEKVAA